MAVAKFEFTALQTRDQLDAERDRAMKEFKAGNIDVDKLGELLDDYAKAIKGAAKNEAAAEQLGEFRIKATPSGCVGMRGVPGASGQFGLSLYPVTIQFLYAKENREKIEAFMAEHKDALSWGKDDAEKFAAQKAEAAKAYAARSGKAS